MAGTGSVTRGLPEILLMAYRTYASFDPEARENYSVVNMAFVNRAAPDIHGKLQRLEGFKGKVYNNRETLEDKQRDWPRYSGQHWQGLKKKTSKDGGIWKYT